MIAERIQRMIPLLDERQKRLYLANEAISYGRGGISLVSRISGMSRTTITKAVDELNTGDTIDGKTRRNGGGRKLIESNYPDIEEKIRRIIDGKTYGDPMRVLSYTTESLRKIQTELEDKNIFVGHVTVGKILEAMDYSKQVNQKMLQIGEPHPDRNAQFEYINKTAAAFLEADEPVISVDTKKKEKVGNFKNDGSEYRPKKEPRKVLGKYTFPKAKMLCITCDCGGSNGNRGRMWKYQLQQFSDRTHLGIHVSHFPPGTAKWNKIEHRLFCYITKTWQGKPLIDVQTAIELIGATRTATGLKVICVHDDTEYELAKKVSDEDFAKIKLVKIVPFESWNYRISSR